MTLGIQLVLLAFLIPAAWLLGNATYEEIKHRIRKRRDGES